MEGDLRDRDLVHDLTRGKDLVFHQAAIRITQCAEEPRLALEVLVDGTFNTLEAAADSKVSKVVAASSASVYGLADRFPTDERHHHLNNDTFYGAAKSFNEGMARSFRAMYGLDYVMLRYFNVYGPAWTCTGSTPRCWCGGWSGSPTGSRRSSSATGSRPWTSRSPPTSRGPTFSRRPATSPRVYNIASGRETSLLELAETLLVAMGSDLPVVHVPERAVNGVTRRLADTSAARRNLGFQTDVDLEHGLRRLVEWWRPLREEIAAGRARADRS